MAAINEASAKEPTVLKKPRLSLQVQNIAEDTTVIRSLDWDRNRFDIEFGLRNGTTYNSFLIEGSQIALVDTSHKKFEKDWLTCLSNKINPADIHYLIVSHTEPDHSGLIGNILDLNPKIKIIGSKIAIQFLENQVHRSFESKAVKTGDVLDLGTNLTSGVHHKIEFLSTPNLHWPDTIFSYDHGSQILFTCDAFGLHYCSEELFDRNPEEIAPDFRFYYECLMGPNSRSVIQALKRMDSLPDLKIISVGHGPLLKEHLKSWIENYQTWSTEKSKGENYAAICYLSQHGFCDRLSQAIARGIAKANGQAQLVDLRATDAQEISALIGEAQAVVVPTWPSEADADLQSSIGTMVAALHQKQWIAVYDCYGENDEPIDSIANQLRTLVQKEAFSPLRVKSIPDSKTYQQFEEAGTDLGQILNRKKNLAAIKNIDSDFAAQGKMV